MKVQQPVLMLCRNAAHHDKLFNDCDRHGWRFRCITGSSVVAQRFLQDACRSSSPLVFVVADSDEDVEHFAPLIQKELRPRSLFPVVLRTNEDASR